MSRLRPNCRVMRVAPTELIDVISVTSAIGPRCRSSGLATLVATVSGLAPGRLRLDRDGREIDLRQRRDRQLHEGEHAGERDADREQHGRDGAGDEEGARGSSRQLRLRSPGAAAGPPR